MKFPDTLRVKHPLGWTHKKGDPFGCFAVKYGHVKIFMVASDASDPSAQGWEHVSVSLEHRTPNWEEMSFVKGLFWDDDECVVQFHPPKKDYVNFAENCLHLWRYTNGDIPRPPKMLVGPSKD